MEERYGLSHEEDEKRPSASQEEGIDLLKEGGDMHDIDNEGPTSDRNAGSDDEELDDEEAESDEEDDTDVGDDASNEDESRSSG